MRTAYESPFLRVQIDDAARAVVVTRLPVEDEAMDAIAEMRASSKALPADPAAYRLVFDVRRVRGRNDADFEQRILPAFLQMASRFGAVAVVVASAIGKLQAQRLSRERQTPYALLTDDAEIEAFIAEGC